MLINKLYFMIHLKYQRNKKKLLNFFSGNHFHCCESFHIQISGFVRRRFAVKSLLCLLATSSPKISLTERGKINFMITRLNGSKSYFI